MYLHIGEGKALSKKDIIGIFDLENTSIGKKTREFLRKCEKQGEIEYLGYEIPRTYIVTKNKEKERVYMTQISVQTLNKRAERNESLGTENK